MGSHHVIGDLSKSTVEEVTGSNFTVECITFLLETEKLKSYYSLYCLFSCMQGQRGALVYSSCLGLKTAGPEPGQVVSSSQGQTARQTTFHTHDSLELPISLMCISLDCGRSQSPPIPSNPPVVRSHETQGKRANSTQKGAEVGIKPLTL